MGVGATFALLFVLLHTAASTGQIYFLHFTKIWIVFWRIHFKE